VTIAWRIDHGPVAGQPAVQLRLTEPAQFNSALAAAVLAREADILAATPPTPVAGLADGLTTHWQEYNLLTWPDRACAVLRDAVLAGCAAWMERNAAVTGDHELIAISCWANALRGDERLTAHSHAPAFLLGNYLIDNGGGDGGATLYFDEAGGHERLAPEAGRLVICPGAVRHAVERHEGPRPRLSAAFDAFVRRQNPLLYLDVPDAMAPFTGPRWFTPNLPVEEIA
jgi:hypothetical protein